MDYSLYLVTDDPSRYGGNWLDNVVASVEGGVTCVQYRDTENVPKVQYERILKLKAAIGGRVPIIVNNDAELAKAVKAAGVHVGQHDMAPADVRKIVGSGCEIGLSITKLDELHGVNTDYVDCLGIGPVFDARKTKADASEAIGVEGLKRIVDFATTILPGMPNVAIGGIKFDNAAQVLAAGVGGLAVVSAFSKAEDPYEVARNFALLFDHRRQ